MREWAHNSFLHVGDWTWLAGAQMIHELDDQRLDILQRFVVYFQRRVNLRLHLKANLKGPVSYDPISITPPCPQPTKFAKQLTIPYSNVLSRKTASLEYEPCCSEIEDHICMQVEEINQSECHPFPPKAEWWVEFSHNCLPFWARVQTFPSILWRLNCFHTQIWAWYPAVITYHSKPQLTESIIVIISWDPMKFLTEAFTKARTYWEVRFLSLHRIYGLHNWPDSLRLQDPDKGNRLLNADDLLRQFVGWYTKERKQESEILHQNNEFGINRLQWACMSE